MSIFNNYITRALVTKILQSSQYAKYTFVLHSLPKDWIDNHGNTLYHYSAFHQKEDLFHIAQKKQTNINLLDKKGRGAIHRLIEYGFIEKTLMTSEAPSDEPPQSWKERIRLKFRNYFKPLRQWIHNKVELHWYNDDPRIKEADKKKKNGYEFRINQNLVNLFIENQADINLLINYGNDPNFRRDTGVYSLDNIAGSPIELLIVLFKKSVLTASFEMHHDEDALSMTEYEKTFNHLIMAGANINLILDKSMLSEQVRNDVQHDATQEISELIVSHYFMKYISMGKDCYSILPLLCSPTLNFSLQDGTGATVLHTLFGRINSRSHVIDRKMIIQMFLAIYHNPAFNENILEIRNNGNLKPLEIFKRENRILAQDFTHMLLAGKLTKELIDQNEDEEDELTIIKI
jgi:hypothetical protein